MMRCILYIYIYRKRFTFCCFTAKILYKTKPKTSKTKTEYKQNCKFTTDYKTVWFI